MAHTATSIVGKDADSAPSKNIFLFGQHTQSRTRYVHGTPTERARAPELRHAE